jgi:hypothetical protein
MTGIVLQYLELENLLAEAGQVDGLRVHALEQSRSTSSNMLTWREITIGLCVRGIAPGDRILSWYGQVEKVGFYTQGQPGNGETSPEQERYHAAWRLARELQAELATRLRQEEHTVYTDGLIELPITHFLRGHTRLITLPDAAGEAEGAA